MKIFIFHHGLLKAGLAKTKTHRVLFLVSMDSQRSKKFDGSHFWALECLLTASGWLESIRGHNGPALTLNVIPEPDRNRVNRFSKNYTLRLIVFKSREIFSLKTIPLGISQTDLKIIMFIEFMYCMKFCLSSFCSSYICK